MKLKSHNYRNTLYFVLFLAVVAVVSGIGIFREPLEQTKTMKLGGLRSTAHNSGEIESMGRFAVEQHNKNKNTLLEFGRIVSAQEQVVAGKLYHLKLEAVDGGKKKIYEAKVWVKPWMNFKQLQEFKEVGAYPITSSDHGTKHGD